MNHIDFVRQGLQVYPGSEVNFDGKILIEFTHYERFDE